MKHINFICMTCVCLFFCASISAQEFILDDNTKSLFHYNEKLGSVEQEVPATTGTHSYYNSGIQGKAINLYSTSDLSYNATGKIQGFQGSFEVWVRSNWSASDGVSRTIMAWGGAGGMLIEKDGGSYLKIIINRFSSDPGEGEISVGVNVSDWATHDWHHVACTWSPSSVKIFVDGVLENEVDPGYTLSEVDAETFSIGSDYGNNIWSGQMDALRMSYFERSETDIIESFNSQMHHHDAISSMLVHFEDTEDGEVIGGWTDGAGVNYSPPAVFQKAAYMTGAQSIEYEAEGNITSDMGTLEGWVRPSFDPGPNGGDRTILRWGGAGGILIFVNGTGLRIIANRYGSGGNPERGIAIDVTDWTPYKWHHVAFTWSAEKLEMYIDGSKVGEETVGFTLPDITDTNFQIGRDGGGNGWFGRFDELRISDNVRTAEEIYQSFLNGIDITGLTLKENDIEVYPNWRYRPEVCIETALDEFPVNSSVIDWSSSNNALATIDALGDINFHQPGNVTLTATVNGFSVNLNVIIKTPELEPTYPSIDTEMSTPAECHKEKIKVLVINYFPTQDGEYLDIVETGPDLGDDPVLLSEIEATVNTNNIQMKHMSEERTKFRGYSNPDADPYIGYEVIDYINVYEAIPRFWKVPHQGNPDNGYINFIDMVKIAERFDWQNYVDNLGVEEIWVWAYHHDVPGGVFGWESDMASPTTGDVSNSLSYSPETDLPVYSSTYTTYGFNYGRTPNLHNQGHQLETMFKYVDADMFLNKFTGDTEVLSGRCGDVHHPPNTTVGYDYTNLDLVESDIANWEPNGGPTELVNANTWGDVDYNWPYGLVPPAETEVNFYIYWMQSFPGYLNTIPNNGDYMTNWWEFVADWDNSISNNLGLYAGTLTGEHPDDDCPNELECEVVSFSSFESGFEGWIDGGIDCLRRKVNPNSGKFSVLIRDNSGPNSSLISPNYEFESIDEVQIHFSFFAVSMEVNEDFFLELSLDGGLTYETVETWARGTDFDNNVRYDVAVNVENYVFTNNTTFRFRCDASVNNDKVYLDDIEITSCVGAGGCIVGNSCSDGNDCTINDTYDQFCECIGLYVDEDSDGFCVGEDPDDINPCIPVSCGVCVLYDIESFETDFGMWNDGGADCARFAYDYYANSGSYSVRIRSNSGSASSFTSDPIDMSENTVTQVWFHYHAQNMEEGEDFFVEISQDGGTTYGQSFQFISGEDFENQDPQSEQVYFNGPFSDNCVIRFRCDASDNFDKVYIDDVEIYLCGETEANPITDGNGVDSRTSQEDIVIYPNPVASGQSLFIEIDASHLVDRIHVLDANGRLVLNLEWDSELAKSQIIVDDLNSGTYMLRAYGSQSTYSKRFILTN